MGGVPISSGRRALADGDKSKEPAKPEDPKGSVKDIKPEDVEQVVKAKVGETRILDIDQDKPKEGDPATIEWIFIEKLIDKGSSVYELVNQSKKKNDDGSFLWSFEFKFKKAGEDHVSFVLGDSSKEKEALEKWKKKKEEKDKEGKKEDTPLNIEDLKATKFAQIDFHVEE